MATASVHASGSWLGVFLFFVASLVLIASLVAAGGAFFYKKYLVNSIAAKSKTLQDTEAAFDPATIEDLIRLDKRMAQAQGLVQKHVSALGVFNFLAEQTLQNVQFTQFAYELEESGIANILLSGDADGFPTVALQSDKFGGSKLLSNVVFSGVTVGTTGRVKFTVKADVDPDLISYAKNLAQSSSVPQLAPATSTPLTQ